MSVAAYGRSDLGEGDGMMKRPKRDPVPCVIPGCKVKDARYRSGIADADLIPGGRDVGREIKTCGRHTLSLESLEVAVGLLGGTVDRGGERAQFVNLDAPSGRVWGASGTHTLCVSWGTSGDRWGDKGGRELRNLAIYDAFERLAYGLSSCEDPECELCHPEESDTD